MESGYYEVYENCTKAEEDRMTMEKEKEKYLEKLKELKSSHRLMGQTDVLKQAGYRAYDRAIKEYDRVALD
jgi:CRISPR/Cas system-associated endonuclease Cas1